MEVNKHKTALVAGDTGFIDSHLCDLLVKDGYKVLCMEISTQDVWKTFSICREHLILVCKS